MSGPPSVPADPPMSSARPRGLQYESRQTAREEPVMPQQRVTPNLWFDTQAEEAAEFYCSIFPNSRIV